MERRSAHSISQSLLSEYRATAWRQSALKTVPGVPNNILRACADQMRYTRELVEALRSNKLLGEKLYWIIYATYMTDKQPIDIDEILDYIAKNHQPVPRRTYFRLRGRAINLLDNRLKEEAREMVATDT